VTCNQMFKQLQGKRSFRGAYVVYFLYYKVFSVVKERTAGMKSCNLAKAIC